MVGPNRIATFSSAADQLTYEVGGAGSELFDAMVKHGMIDGGAPQSVESAFGYARRTLAKNFTSLPVMRDGIPGDLVLGPVTWGPPLVVAAAPPPLPDVPAATPEPAPDPTAPPDSGGLAGILCGLLGCHHRN